MTYVRKSISVICVKAVFTKQEKEMELAKEWSKEDLQFDIKT